MYREIQEVMLYYVTSYIQYSIQNEEFEQLLLENPLMSSVLLKAFVDLL